MSAVDFATVLRPPLAISNDAWINTHKPYKTLERYMLTCKPIYEVRFNTTPHTHSMFDLDYMHIEGFTTVWYASKDSLHPYSGICPQDRLSFPFYGFSMNHKPCPTNQLSWIGIRVGNVFPGITLRVPYYSELSYDKSYMIKFTKMKCMVRTWSAPWALRPNLSAT